jgi:hypothetical protein
MRRLFRLGLWLGILVAAGYAVSRYLRTQDSLGQPTGDGWTPQPSTPVQPVAMKAEPAAEPPPASPVEAPVVATDETATAEPTKKAPAKKKAAAKKAAPAKDAPKKAPPKKA